jgi:hypothetical protein
MARELALRAVSFVAEKIGFVSQKTLRSSTLLPCQLPKPYTWSVTVLLDEHDAGALESAANREIVCCRHGSLAIGQLGAPDRRDAQRTFASQIFRTPPNKPASNSDLRTDQRADAHERQRTMFEMKAALTENICSDLSCWFQPGALSSID